MIVHNKIFNIRMDLIGSYLHSAGEDEYDEIGIYSDMLDVLAKRLKARIKQHYQNVILITGGTGSGKSNLAIQLIKAIDPDWDLRENYIYSIHDLARKLAHRETASPISLFDEGSVILNSLNFNRKEDKAVSNLFNTMRSLGWTTVIACPLPKNLNGSVKEAHLTYHLICPDKPLIEGYDRRGFFEVYLPIRRQWSDKVYSKCLAAGVHRKMPKALNEQYEEIKLDKQMRLLDDFVKEFGRSEGVASDGEDEP